MESQKKQAKAATEVGFDANKSLIEAFVKLQKPIDNMITEFKKTEKERNEELRHIQNMQIN